MVRDLLGKIPRSLYRARLAKGISAYVRKRLDFSKPTEEDDQQIVESELPPHFVPLTGRPKHRIGRIVRDYLIDDRQLTDEILMESGVGYCIDGRWKGYAVFPVYVGGHLVTWTSRRVVAFGPRVQHDPQSKSRMALFNYDVCLEGGYKRVFVGEGPFDAWSFHTVGNVNGGVGLLGKKLHTQQIKLLRALPCAELCMCLDSTEHEKSMEYAYKLKKACPDKRITALLLDDGDPNENIRKLGRLCRRRQDVGLASRVRSKLDGILVNKRK
jgi:hypothetical protein